MAAVTVFEKPTCTTCRQLNKLLRENGVDVEKIDYHVLGLTRPQLDEIVAKTGLTPAELLRRREDGARALAGADDETILAAMLANPALLERPVVIRGERAVLARPATKVLELF